MLSHFTFPPESTFCFFLHTVFVCVWIRFLVLYLRNLTLTKGWKYFPLYFFLEILEFKCFTGRSRAYFELIFILYRYRWKLLFLFLFFLYWCSIVLASNIEKTIISILDDLCILVDISWPYKCAHISQPYSVQLIHLSFLQ